MSHPNAGGDSPFDPFESEPETHTVHGFDFKEEPSREEEVTGNIAENASRFVVYCIAGALGIIILATGLGIGLTILRAFA